MKKKKYEAKERWREIFASCKSKEETDRQLKIDSELEKSTEGETEGKKRGNIREKDEYKDRE